MRIMIALKNHSSNISRIYRSMNLHISKKLRIWCSHKNGRFCLYLGDGKMRKISGKCLFMSVRFLCEGFI